jgi:serine/threonine protein kinase
VWSLGIMTYMMLTGRAPFNGGSKSAIYKSVLNSEPDFSIFKKYNKNAIDFVKKCLIKDFKERPFIHDLKDHPWLNTMVHSAHISELE